MSESSITLSFVALSLFPRSANKVQELKMNQMLLTCDCHDCYDTYITKMRQDLYST